MGKGMWCFVIFGACCVLYMLFGFVQAGRAVGDKLAARGRVVQDWREVYGR